MKHDEIIRYINFVANKYQEGLYLQPADYNTLANIYNHYLFQKEYDTIEVMAKTQGMALYDALHNSSSLRVFKSSAVLIVSSNSGTLPADFVFCYSMQASYSGGIKVVDIVSERDYLLKRSDSLSDVATNPIAVLYPDSFKIVPQPPAGTGVVSQQPRVTIVYLRKPADVFFDYCVIEETDTVLYMPVGSYIDYSDESGEEDILVLYDSEGEEIQSGVDHFTASSYPYTSLSVEFEWEDRMTIKIISYILEAMGVAIKDQFLFEASKINQQ